MQLIINLNERAYVILTEEGANIYNSNWDHYPDDKKPEKALMGQKLEIELWELMNIFGKHLYHGCAIPFEGNIIIFETKF